MTQSLQAQLAGHPLVLYDGVCGLCHRLVRFVVRHDAEGRYRFCALQDPFAVKVLVRYGLDPASLNTACLLTHPFAPEERLLVSSDAVLAVLTGLGGGWRRLAGLLRLVPRPLRDLGYGLMARIRYRLFGRLKACPLPAPGQRDRFLLSG